MSSFKLLALILLMWWQFAVPTLGTRLHPPTLLQQLLYQVSRKLIISYKVQQSARYKVFCHSFINCNNKGCDLMLQKLNLFFVTQVSDYHVTLCPGSLLKIFWQFFLISQY